jgi:hypothetical protein
MYLISSFSRTVVINASKFFVVFALLSIATARIIIARNAAVTARRRAEASFEMPLGPVSDAVGLTEVTPKFAGRSARSLDWSSRSASLLRLSQQLSD